MPHPLIHLLISCLITQILLATGLVTIPIISPFFNSESLIIYSLKLDSVEKTSFIMGSELWKENFSALLSLVKRYIVDMWEARKIKFCGNDSCPSKLQSQHSAENLAGIEGKFEVKSLL